MPIYGRLGFSRNLRKEIAKSRRYYFYDNGIRNGLINNFNPLALRDDVGALWENYVMVERLKCNLYAGRHAESYFWRTYDGQEIDLIEERGGRLDGTEMKWSPKRRHRVPRAWGRAYKLLRLLQAPQLVRRQTGPGRYRRQIRRRAPQDSYGANSLRLEITSLRSTAQAPSRSAGPPAGRHAPHAGPGPRWPRRRRAARCRFSPRWTRRR